MDACILTIFSVLKTFACGQFFSAIEIITASMSVISNTDIYKHVAQRFRYETTGISIIHKLAIGISIYTYLQRVFQ